MTRNGFVASQKCRPNACGVEHMVPPSSAGRKMDGLSRILLDGFIGRVFMHEEEPDIGIT
jgi:hypothetical protein